ncbi:MAG TPA: hypothetical protein PLN21_22260 [Gemmatales bacterium]|nr:hypothetical protein [Gemmatales bacterium]
MFKLMMMLLIVAASLGCSSKSVEMPKKIALPPTEPAKFSQNPDLTPK